MEIPHMTDNNQLAIVTSTKRGSSMASIMRMVAIVLSSMIIALAFTTISPSTALADVTIGGEELHGWTPDEMAQTDINVNEENVKEVPQKAESVVVTVVRIILPLFAIACVVIIIYNAIANPFREEEKKVKMGQLVKNIFASFCWILGAWLVVELIIFVVIYGENLITNILLT